MLEKTEDAPVKSVHSAQEREALQLLERLGGERVANDDIVREGTRLVLPATMSPTDALRFLADHIKAQETEHQFVREFPYRPADVAYAFQEALRQAFGNTGIGKATMTMFGPQPPQMRTIAIGPHGETAQVPAGELRIPVLQAVGQVGANHDREVGLKGVVYLLAPKKFDAHIEGLFRLVEENLRERSIYRGKPIYAADEPGYIDVDTLDPAKIVLAEDTRTQLEASILTPLRKTARMRELGRSLKISALMEGPYGTGKTSMLTITAQEAVANGWTAIHVRPGRDSIEEGIRLARQYQPAVLLVEDVDTFAASAEKDAVSELLDMFDGIQAKGTEIVVLMTTNNVEKIHKGMLRPGRLDAVIHVGAMDDPGYVALCRLVLGDQLVDMTPDDEQRVSEALQGYVPAFVVEALERASRYAVARENGHSEQITVDDVVHSAQGLRDQLRLMEEAGEGTPKPSLDESLRRLVQDEVNGAVVTHYAPTNDKGEVLTDAKSLAEVAAEGAQQGNAGVLVTNGNGS